MNLTENELCILQQALGLRESVMINSTDLLKEPPEGLHDTKLLRIKVIREIGYLRREMYGNERPNCTCKSNLRRRSETVLG